MNPADSTGISPTPSAEERVLRIPPEKFQEWYEKKLLTHHERMIYEAAYAAAEAHYAPLVETADLVLKRAVWPASPPCPVEYLSAFRAFSDAVDLLRAARQTGVNDPA